MITVYTDGGCSGNPGPMFGAGLILDKDIIIHSFAVPLGDGTNNIAEYRAIETAMDWLISECHEGPVDFYSDSKLCVNQLNGVWSVQGHLYEICSRLQQKRQLVKPCTFTHVRRTNPWIMEADRLVKEVSLEARQKDG